MTAGHELWLATDATFESFVTKAGVPTVIVPFFADQPFWASRVQALGVGPKPFPRQKLTTQRLAEAIEVATTDDEMRRRAAELGQKIRAEDALATTVDLIKRLLREQKPV